MKIKIANDAEASARNQRQSVRLLADKIEAGEELNGFQRKFVAGFLRAYADKIQAPRRQGPPSKLPESDEAAMEVAILIVDHNYSQTRAREEVAEKYEVSVEALRKHLKKDRRGERALEFVRAMVAESEGDTTSPRST